MSDPFAVGHDFAVGAFEDDASAEFAGAGAEIDDVVGGAHEVGIVLDDDDGIAEVAQFFEDADEAAGVAAECSPMDGSSRT